MHVRISVNVAVMVKATCAIVIYFLETQSTSSLTYILKSSSGNYNFLIIKYFQIRTECGSTTWHPGAYLSAVECIPEILGYGPFPDFWYSEAFFCLFHLSRKLKLSTAAHFHSVVNLIIILSSYIPLNRSREQPCWKNEKHKTLKEFIFLGRVLRVLM